MGWMPWDYAEQSGILKKWADKYGIKIELTQINDYVESINQYTAGQFDACVMTNMDMLTIPAAGGVDSTALIVGDYSNGNDGVVLKGKGKKLADIKGQSVNLVELSVSHYLLARGLDTVGLKERDIKVVNTSDADIVGAFATPGGHGDGHLEAAAHRRSPPCPRPRWCSIRARSPARSSISWWSTPQVLKDNPKLGKALVGAWYETLARDAGQGREGHGRARIHGQGLGHRPRRLQGPARDDQPVRHAGQRRGRDHEPGPGQDDGPGAQVLLRPWPARRRRQDASMPSASSSRAARRSATRNIKMRFDATYMKMAADGKL